MRIQYDGEVSQVGEMYLGRLSLVSLQRQCTCEEEFEA